ncbi:fructose-bisphosphatase class III, partial [Listeria monocytogenes]|nr:fructose-bisphosphatase class III [Listeria monocytogenes]
TLAAHQPFTDRQQAIQQRRDIVTQKKIVVRQTERTTVGQTDIGKRLQQESLVLFEELKNHPIP